MNLERRATETRCGPPFRCHAVSHLSSPGTRPLVVVAGVPPHQHRLRLRPAAAASADRRVYKINYRHHHHRERNILLCCMSLARSPFPSPPSRGAPHPSKILAQS
ncbi:unnamed protein product [Ectocarpus sp. 12 AP-2014]